MSNFLWSVSWIYVGWVARGLVQTWTEAKARCNRVREECGVPVEKRWWRL